MNSNKTALITGASSGIGKELAYIHAKKGGDLVIVARRAEKLEAIKADLEATCRVRVLVIPKDLAQPGAAKEVYDEIKESDITIHYLINNAGFGGHGKFHERVWETDLTMINLNIVALTTLTRLFVPDFVARKAGRILNVSSTAALVPGGPLQAVYFATKAYVTSFSYAIAEELHDTGVTVTTLMPGATETEFAQTSGMDKTELFSNTVSAHSVAEDGYNAMLKGKLDVISGLTTTQRMQIAGIPITPNKLLLKMMRKLQEVPVS